MIKIKKNATFSINKKIIDKFKRTCEERGLIQSKIINNLIEKWLEKQEE